MMVLITNVRAEDNKDVDEELLNKVDEEGISEGIITETLENTKDASIDETNIGEDDQEEDDDNAMNVILEEDEQFQDPQLIRVGIRRRPFSPRRRVLIRRRFLPRRRVIYDGPSWPFLYSKQTCESSLK